MDKFYKYIVKCGNSYCIMKNNEKFGTYSRLEDALYERDRLIESDWDWEDSLELPETDNPYMKMNLPRFVHEYSYISEVRQTYKVFKGGEYKGRFNTKKDAYEYAERIGGKVSIENKRYRVSKHLDGRTVYFGQYPTLDEAKKRRDELIKSGWKQ